PTSGSDVEALGRPRMLHNGNGNPSAQRCVRDAFCWLGFPLAGPLPSTASAVGCPTLFGGFIGTICPSDFPRSFIAGSWLRPSRRVPGPICPWAIEGSPGSRGWRVRACEGSWTAPNRTGARGTLFVVLGGTDWPPRGSGVAVIQGDRPKIVASLPTGEGAC